MHRTLVFSIDEIGIDYKTVGRTLNSACQRDNTRYRIVGLCQTDDSIFFALEQMSPENNGFRYVIAPFSGTSNEEIKADIYTRWSSGFSTKGLIRLSESYLGLFESHNLRKIF